jgi:hypothetical protein
MPAHDLPIALAKWYDCVKWVLDRVDGFPKNQRFVLGTRLADAVLEVRPPHSPTPIPVLTVSGAPGAKANS